MKSLRLEVPGQLLLHELPEAASPQKGEVLVQVHRAGVCGTDMHAWRGKQPFFEFPRILGHELGVEVLEIGPNVQDLRVGDRGAVEPYLECGECIACRRGKPNCCEHLHVLGVHSDGGWRERFLLPARKLHVSKTLSYEQLASIEPLAIGAHAVARATLENGERALVIGAGPIGLAVALFARLAGSHVAVMDINHARLEFAKTFAGADVTLNASDSPNGIAPEIIAQKCGGDLPTSVFDATGSKASMERAFQLVAHGGALTFVGLFPGEVTFSDPNFHKRELTLRSSRNALSSDFSRIIAGMERGEINAGSWQTHSAPFADVPEVWESWLAPDSGVVKAMIAWR